MLARHTFVGADTDTDAAVAGANTLISALNIFLEPGAVYPATGNVLVPYALPATGTTTSLGGFEDGATGTAVALYYNSAGFHRLVRYDPAANTGAGAITTLLEWEGLNLSPDLAMQGDVVDGLLLYLGADGYLRCINLARAEAGVYTTSLLEAEPYALHLVKTPPVLPPGAVFANGTGDPRDDLRLIQTKAYQFAVRWRYLDGEVTVLSPFSEWMDVTDNPVSTAHRSIFLVLPPAPSGVAEVEVLARDAQSGGWAIADTLRRTGGTLPDTFSFYGIFTGGPLTEAEAARTHEDEWPGRAAVIARSRAFKGRVTKGYRTPAAPFTAETVVVTGTTDFRTFHEGCAYRVALQFYDAQNKPFGCSAPVVVQVPANNGPLAVLRRLNVALTTPLPGQHAEIPAEADSYQFLVAPNDRTGQFMNGQAADTRAFLGYIRTIAADGTTRETTNLPVRTTAHEKLWVDIGNWPAVGLGYVWTPDSGDLLRFSSTGQTFAITGQYGDYVEIQWSGAPAEDRPLVEIYTPNTTPSDLYYERGPRLKVLRDADGTRRYEQTTTTLSGDVFLLGLNFPLLEFGGPSTYNPPDIKRYTGAVSLSTVEGMVPLYRLQSSSPITTTTQAGFAFKRFVAGEAPPISPFDPLGVRQKVLPGQAASVWLDMSYGGRPGVAVPLALQRVERLNELDFSGVKQQGNLVNGLSQWDAFNEVDRDIPQEQGAITALRVAAQAQSEGSVLLVTQERGAVTLSLGRRQLQTGDDETLVTISNDVVGSGTVLRGGYGCTDPRAVVSAGGKVFYPCRQREEVLRFDRNGNVPLGETYKFSARLKALFRQYANAPLSACYHPRRYEYWLTFQPIDELPGATVVFSDRPNREAWADQVTGRPEAGAAVGNELVTWVNAGMARHAVNAPVGTFHGVYEAPQLQFIVAAPADVSKRWQTMEVVSDSLWLPAYVYTDTGQQSQTRPEWWTEREGVWRMPEGLRRDQNTPGFAGRPWQAIDEGLPLVSPRLTVTVIAPEGAPAPLSSVGVSWLVRPGQSSGIPA